MKILLKQEIFNEIHSISLDNENYKKLCKFIDKEHVFIENVINNFNSIKNEIEDIVSIT